MRPPFSKKPSFGLNRDLGKLSARLKDMLSLMENTLAQFDPADAAGLSVLQQHFDTMWHEFDKHRLQANNAQRRMRAYYDRHAGLHSEDEMQDCNDGELVVAESLDYAHDAILVAEIALEEAELATLKAVLNKIEAERP